MYDKKSVLKKLHNGLIASIFIAGATILPLGNSSARDLFESPNSLTYISMLKKTFSGVITGVEIGSIETYFMVHSVNFLDPDLRPVYGQSSFQILEVKAAGGKKLRLLFPRRSKYSSPYTSADDGGLFNVGERISGSYFLMHSVSHQDLAHTISQDLIPVRSGVVTGIDGVIKIR